jgi:peptidoglycan/LPS O-acetylase OafA/YrhL
MEISFKRITTSGNFIPEVDGLRFVAIFSIVAYHLGGFIIVKDTNVYIDDTEFILFKRILSHAYLGIPLFFVISGFVLGLPFARYRILGDKPVLLRQYFMRRVTRLEPPYIISMTVLFFGTVYVAKIVSVKLGVASYLASIFYIHNFLFKVLPILNGSAWSLEVEIQFYILVPLITFIYSVRSASLRRVVFVSAILTFLVFNNVIHLPVRSFMNYAQFFLLGLLLADFKASKDTIFLNTRFDFIITLLLFVFMWLYDSKDFNSRGAILSWNVIQLCNIFFLYYYVIFHKAISFFSFKAITNIGGMCYSIYLLHYPVISLFGNPLLNCSFSSISYLNRAIYTVVLMFLVLVISALYFLIIERPCMEKNWYKKLYWPWVRVQ